MAAAGTQVKDFAIGAAILLVIAGVVLVIRKRGDIAAALATINPADERNVINQAVSGVVQAVTGDPNATLGTKLQELTQRAKDAIGVPATAPIGAPLPSGTRCFVEPCPPGTFLLIRINPTTGAREGFRDGKWERILTTQTFGVPAKPAGPIADFT